jgi:hypothetical protein
MFLSENVCANINRAVLQGDVYAHNMCLLLIVIVIVYNQMRFQSYFARAVLLFKIHNLCNCPNGKGEKFGAKVNT